MSGRFLAIAAAGVAIAAVAVSIWLNPPADNRARSLDDIRAERLRDMQRTIDAYFGRHKTLPARLDVFRSQMDSLSSVNWHDPETGRPFEYHILGNTSYRLCATFERDSDSERVPRGLFHHAGRTCFDNQLKS